MQSNNFIAISSGTHSTGADGLQRGYVLVRFEGGMDGFDSEKLLERLTKEFDGRSSHPEKKVLVLRVKKGVCIELSHLAAHVRCEIARMTPGERLEFQFEEFDVELLTAAVAVG